MFSPVESLLNRMTIHQPNGTAGLLAMGQFGDAVISELRGLDLEKEINKVIASDDQVRFGHSLLDAVPRLKRMVYSCLSLLCSETTG